MRHSVQAYRRIQLEQWLIEADELGMFFNLGVCLLHEKGEVGLKPENLCWVVGLKQLECLLKVSVTYSHEAKPSEDVTYLQLAPSKC